MSKEISRSHTNDSERAWADWALAQKPINFGKVARPDAEKVALLVEQRYQEHLLRMAAEKAAAKAAYEQRVKVRTLREEGKSVKVAGTLMADALRKAGLVR